MTLDKICQSLGLKLDGDIIRGPHPRALIALALAGISRFDSIGGVGIRVIGGDQ